jgi:hypothetical protein
MRFVLLTAMMLVPGRAILGADRPDLSGTWRMEDRADSPPVTIQQEGSNLNIKSAPGSGDLTEVNCNTMGKQCEGKLSGDDAKMSYWFNGPELVEMAIESKNRVTETRRRLSEDGNKMIVEVIPIAPGGRSREKFVFVREPPQLASGSTAAK